MHSSVKSLLRKEPDELLGSSVIAVKFCPKAPTVGYAFPPGRACVWLGSSGTRGTGRWRGLGRLLSWESVCHISKKSCVWVPSTPVVCDSNPSAREITGAR